MNPLLKLLTEDELLYLSPMSLFGAHGVCTMDRSALVWVFWPLGLCGQGVWEAQAFPISRVKLTCTFSLCSGTVYCFLAMLYCGVNAGIFLKGHTLGKSVHLYVRSPGPCFDDTNGHRESD